MLSEIKTILKKYWIHLIFILIINIPIICLCTIRTNSFLLLKGDTTPFDSVVEIDNDYIEEGSFSTIYVINMNRSTIFQNMLAEVAPHVEKGEISNMESHISDLESYQAGKIQYLSSITTSLILAYSEAMKLDSSIKIDYKPRSYTITWYSESSRFRIGDEIVAVNGHRADSKEFDERLNEWDQLHFYLNDEITYIRNGVENTIKMTKDDLFLGYRMFDINLDNTTPKYKINNNAVGGPSGGLLQTLSIYNRLTAEDITHGLKIAGTGTISMDGAVGAIGGIKEKVPTAFDDHVDVFFCVADNYEEALEAYNLIPNHERMRLIRIETFYDALDYLKEGYKNDFK